LEWFPLMPRNTSGLKRTAGPGRPKGLPNKATREFKQWAELFFRSREYREKAERRLLEGRAPQLEVYMFQMLYGKPKEQVEFSDLREVPDSVTFVVNRAAGAENRD